MARFYGKVKGGRGEGTRLGSATSGLTTTAAGWKGAIKVELSVDAETGRDRYLVTLTPWEGSGGQSTVLLTGELDANAPHPDAEFLAHHPEWMV